MIQEIKVLVKYYVVLHRKILYNMTGNGGCVMEKFTIKRMTMIALVAALYVTISIALAPISFGNIQVRIAEALTLLPILFVDGISGVTLGCFLTNLVGTILGVNVLGPLDILFGTLATLIAAILTYYLRNYQIKGISYLSLLPPIIINGIIIGAELTYVLSPTFTLPYFLLFTIEVAFGQAIAILVFGLPLLQYLKKIIKE